MAQTWIHACAAITRGIRFNAPEQKPVNEHSCLDPSTWHTNANPGQRAKESAGRRYGAAAWTPSQHVSDFQSHIYTGNYKKLHQYLNILSVEEQNTSKEIKVFPTRDTTNRTLSVPKKQLKWNQDAETIHICICFAF